MWQYVRLYYILNTPSVFSIWLGNILLEIAEPRLSDTDDELNELDGDVDDKTDACEEGTSSGS